MITFFNWPIFGEAKILYSTLSFLIIFKKSKKINKEMFSTKNIQIIFFFAIAMLCERLIAMEGQDEEKTSQRLYKILRGGLDSDMSLTQNEMKLILAYVMSEILKYRKQESEIEREKLGENEEWPGKIRRRQHIEHIF
jgi:hypothetical protein